MSCQASDPDKPHDCAVVDAIERFIDAWNDRCTPSPGPRTPGDEVVTRT